MYAVDSPKGALTMAQYMANLTTGPKDCIFMLIIGLMTSPSPVYDPN